MDKHNFDTVKQSLGNVIYSQKTQEMASIRKHKYSLIIKWINIILVGLVLVALFLQIFHPNEPIYLYIGIGITITEVLFLIVQLNFSPDKDALKHKATAQELWLMREKHLNLLTDIKNETFVSETLSKKRDALTLELNNIYENAPQTSKADYLKAGYVLNSDEKPRAEDEEMENFLPENLR